MKSSFQQKKKKKEIPKQSCSAATYSCLRTLCISMVTTNFDSFLPPIN